MEKVPTISVLMPVYNGQDYLRPAIDSVLNQTFSDFELIIVNDGSTDRTQEIIDSYKDPRIVCIQQQNQGVARSINNGLQKARGKYVRRHDADDISTHESFQLQVDFLEQHPEYVMVCNQSAFMTVSGKVAWKYRVPPNKYFAGKPYVDLSFDDFTLDKASPVVHGTACYRRLEVMDIGAYRREFIVSEDNDLWIRLLEKYKIAVLNQCTYLIRIHPSSATHRHAHKITHFRRLLVEYSLQRRNIGTDPIMRGEPIEPPPPPPDPQSNNPPAANGRRFRDDLRYIYGLMLNAGDYKQVRRIAGEILRDGWKVPATYKLLLFPMLGDRFVKAGVKN